MTEETCVNRIVEVLGVTLDEAEKIVIKAVEGGEVASASGLEPWLEERFLPNVVYIDEFGYARMCIDALKIVQKTAATDYGSSRQRDLGQLWADMTRGYLGELAFVSFAEKKWALAIDLDHEEGEMADFLPQDIHRVREVSQREWRKPRIKVGIKTTKWNGIWLDIPGDQFNHSDVHVFVKIGVDQNHLFAYFKHISVFRDKILKTAEDQGHLSGEEAQALFDKLPGFRPIPAHICGFVQRESAYESLCYTGKRGRVNYTVTGWKGPIADGDLERIKAQQAVSGKVTFAGIGKFAHSSGYLFNTGNLLWRTSDWRAVRDRI